MLSKSKTQKRRMNPCKCKAYPFPHRYDKRRCDEWLPDEADFGDDYTADHKADDPRRGQAKDLNALRP